MRVLLEVTQPGEGWTFGFRREWFLGRDRLHIVDKDVRRTIWNLGPLWCRQMITSQRLISKMLWRDRISYRIRWMWTNVIDYVELKQ